jgi:carnitine 3-dehydrogenase
MIPKQEPAKTLRTQSRIVPVDWTDSNGHMNEGRYGQVFSDAADGFLLAVGVDDNYLAAGHSYFTVETSIKFLNETHAGDHIVVDSTVELSEGKKLKLAHEMKRADGTVLATASQFMLHVSLDTRKSCPPVGAVATALAQFS